MKPVDTIKGYQTEEPSQGPVSRNGRERVSRETEREPQLFCFVFQSTFESQENTTKYLCIINV